MALAFQNQVRGLSIAFFIFGLVALGLGARGEAALEFELARLVFMIATGLALLAFLGSLAWPRKTVRATTSSCKY